MSQNYYKQDQTANFGKPGSVITDFPKCPECESEDVQFVPGKAWCDNCEWRGSPYDLYEQEPIEADG